MRRTALQVLRSKDICLFCAARLEVAATARTARSRPFHADARRYVQPLSQAAAEADRSQPTVTWQPSPPSSLSGGFSSSTPAADQIGDDFQRFDIASDGRLVSADQGLGDHGEVLKIGEDRDGQFRKKGKLSKRTESDEGDVEDADQEQDERPKREKGRKRNPKRYDEDNDDPDNERPARRGQRSRDRMEEDEDEDIDELEELDDNVRQPQRRSGKSNVAKAKSKRFRRKFTGPPTPIVLPEFITVSDLATAVKVRNDEFLGKMEEMGFAELTSDHILDAETAGLVVAEFNFEPVGEEGQSDDLVPREPATDKSKLPARPPVVTIMGHVDHGKTTMLDFLRKSSVAASEHGGITQHIGAFSVRMSGGRLVTFLDTPGHEAFLSMRQRGANVTDIVVLVVAADDSVKPQTIEAIKHAQTAGVPIIVAVNKIDKPESDIERVKQDLPRYGVDIEDIGGDTQVVPVSGKTGLGMDELEESIVALADIMDARAETDGPVEGWVLEAVTTKENGRKATMLVRRGTLRVGNLIVAGNAWARVRALRNEAGVDIDSAGPGTPIEVDGWREQPAAGDEVLEAPSEQKARSVIEFRRSLGDQKQLADDVSAVNEIRRKEHEKRVLIRKARREAKERDENPRRLDIKALLPEAAEDTSAQTVYFIVKADVSGSVEAVCDAIAAVGNNEIKAQILRGAVGPISEFDVDHAAVAQGYLVNFNTPTEGGIQRLADEKGVQILHHSIIYRVVDDIKKIMESKLPPLIKQRVTGEAEVAQVFSINVKARIHVPIAGCRVRNGEISKTSKVRVMRGLDVIYTGTFSSLKNVKKDVTVAQKDSECGMGFEGWSGFAVGDKVQCYDESSERRYL